MVTPSIYYKMGELPAFMTGIPIEVLSYVPPIEPKDSIIKSGDGNFTVPLDQDAYVYSGWLQMTKKNTSAIGQSRLIQISSPDDSTIKEILKCTFSTSELVSGASKTDNIDLSLNPFKVEGGNTIATNNAGSDTNFEVVFALSFFLLPKGIRP